MNAFVENLTLDVIVTYDKHEQDWFRCSVSKDALESEKTLLDYIKGQLKYNDLVKLSLCWVSDDEAILNHETIKESIDKNAKYYFDLEVA